MDSTKTKFWHASALGLQPASGARAEEAVRVGVTTQLGGSPAPAAVRGAAAPTLRGNGSPDEAAVIARPPPLPRASQLPPSASSALRKSPLAATRIMPIERLIPKRAAAAETVQVAPRKRRFRYAEHVLLALLTLLAVTVWKVPLRRRLHSRALPTSAATPTARGPAPLAPPAAEPSEPEQPAPAIHAPSTRSRHGDTASLEREAVSKVIAGDVAAAERLYLELARQRPDVSAFQAAARILAARSAMRSR